MAVAQNSQNPPQNASWGPFDEGPLTIEQRFTSKGRARQDEVWKVYVQQDGVSAPLYDCAGAWAKRCFAIENKKDQKW